MLIDIVAKETETVMNNFWTAKLNNNLNHLIYYEDECQNTYNTTGKLQVTFLSCL